MSAPQLHLHSGPSTTTQASQIVTSTRIEVAGTLRLRGVSAEDRRIRWAEDVVDNEGMGRKSSKVCCIYHAPRAIGESSSESSSDSSSSDSDSDSEPDNSTAWRGETRKKRRQHEHDHDHVHDHDHDDHDHDQACAKQNDFEKSATAGEGPGTRAKGKGKGKGSRLKRSPNAYEKMPKGSRTRTIIQKP